jgi:hypothetical protein
VQKLSIAAIELIEGIASIEVTATIEAKINCSNRINRRYSIN